MKNNKNSVILHGECMVFRSSLPNDIEKITSENENYMVIADSEVTGNHHVVDLAPMVNFFRQKGTDRLFMENMSPTKLRCLISERHTDVILEPNVWEFGTQKEYDHVNDELVSVRD